jgi:hypothetical protein
VSFGAVPLYVASGARDDEPKHILLDPAAAALLEVPLGPAGHLGGEARRHPLQVDQRQVVLRHPEQRPEGPEKRDLAAAAQVAQEQPAGVTGDQGPIYVEKGANPRHGVPGV